MQKAKGRHSRDDKLGSLMRGKRNAGRGVVGRVAESSGFWARAQIADECADRQPYSPADSHVGKRAAKLTRQVVARLLLARALPYEIADSCANHSAHYEVNRNPLGAGPLRFHEAEHQGLRLHRGAAVEQGTAVQRLASLPSGTEPIVGRYADPRVFAQGCFLPTAPGGSGRHENHERRDANQRKKGVSLHRIQLEDSVVKNTVSGSYRARASGAH